MGLYPSALEPADMACPVCDAPVVAFAIPHALRDYAPTDSPHAAICSTCLTVTPVEDGPNDPDFSPILEDFPDGDAGIAMALALGLIVDSVAMNRDDIAELFERVQDEGVDPWLLLERLEVAGSVDAAADLDRAYRQLNQLLR